MKKRTMGIYITIILLAIIGVGIAGYMNLPKFGRSARGERLIRIQQSPNYQNGQFQNQETTPQITSDKNRIGVMFDFLFEKRERNRPETALPIIKTNLKTLDHKKELLVWFGHSSCLIQSSGKRFLVDPVFEDASPVSFINKPFKGTDTYKANDMPDIDFLVITHDHWDHLDYETVVSLKDRVSKVICPLGVGEHFENWGYKTEQIIEMDWNEQANPGNGFTIYCLPTRHFSGRTFKSNQTLWASYIIETPIQTIYLSGDGGYGKHFKKIAEQFPNINFAIIENGQYNKNWRYIHLMPEDLIRVIDDLKPKKVFAGHNGKYALAKHPWDEPLNNASHIESVITPMIGQVVDLQDSTTVTEKWWKLIN